MYLYFLCPDTGPVSSGWSRCTTWWWWPWRSRWSAAGRYGRAGSPGRSPRGTTVPAACSPSSWSPGGHGGPSGTDRSAAAPAQKLDLTEEDFYWTALKQAEMTNVLTVITSIVGWMAVRSLADGLDDHRACGAVWGLSFLLLCLFRWLNIFRPAVTDQVGYVFEDNDSNPVGDLLVLHGAVMKHVGDDDGLQETDDHEGQTNREIDPYNETQIKRWWMSD